jgi:sugar-specific transcriptional regulator TrmB
MNKETLQISTGDLEDELRTFGLSNLQCKILLLLLKSGPLEASLISQTLGRNRVEIYQALRCLSKLGIVEIKLTQPRLYSSADSKTIVQILLNKAEDQVRNLREKSGSLLVSLGSIESDRRNDDLGSRSVRSLMTLKTGSQVKEYWRKLTLSSKKEIICTWSEEGLLALFRADFDSLYKICAQNGIHVLAIANITRRNMFEAEEFAKSVKLFHSTEVEFSHLFSIFDDRMAIVDISELPKNNFEVLLTNNKLLIQGLAYEARKLLESSELAITRIDYLKSNGFHKAVSN